MAEKKALVYKRGSVIDINLENQWIKVAERLISDGLTPSQCLIYEDLGVSRSEYTRPDLNRLQADIEAGKGHTLYCSELTRLGEKLGENILILDFSV